MITYFEVYKCFCLKRELSHKYIRTQGNEVCGQFNVVLNEEIRD